MNKRDTRRRRFCKECGAPVPPDRRVLCSDACARISERESKQRSYRRRTSTPEGRAQLYKMINDAKRASYELERLDKVRDRRCEFCGRLIPLARKVGSKYCTKRHATTSRSQKLRQKRREER